VSVEQLACDVVRMALDRGATDAEATVSGGDDFSVEVRLGEVERLSESGSSGVGVRVMVGSHSGSSHTSDMSRAGLESMVARALDLARITSEDPHAGLPEESELGKLDRDLRLYWDDVERLAAPEKIAMAKRAEKASRDHDPRIDNSDGASFRSALTRTGFANSRGFRGSYRSSHCSLSASPVGTSNGRMERDYWFSMSRSAAGIESPEEVGRKAAERVLRRLNPRKVASCRVPVVFEPRVARTLVGHVFELVSGDAVYRQSSMLAGKMGRRVAAPGVTIVDDPTLPGLYGSSPFDDEGVPSRRTVVVDSGVLSSFLLNTYTARKLGLKTTGSASRGLSGNAAVGHGNLYLEAGSSTPSDLLRAAGTGLYVTHLMGFGFNAVTGDYSRGAAGLWIENGELAYPVSEVTIAANFGAMLEGLEMAANDLEFQGAVAAPTVLIREMTVSGS
jgi:PmbA protein